jgi:hypothetical protein
MGDEDEALTLADAARATGVDRRVLRQRIEGGGFPGAFRQPTTRGTGTGPWLIPIADLVASGMNVDDSTAVRRVPRANGEDEIERLRAELAHERELRLIAEAVAEERSAALEDARLALRAIAEAGAASASPGETEAAYEEESRPRPRGNWLR